jgi:hypothetical protein
MIVRILGEGQFDVPTEAEGELNELDTALADAVDEGDEAAFEWRLRQLLARVRRLGAHVDNDVLTASDVILPISDSTQSEVRGMLGDEGLIPG